MRAMCPVVDNMGAHLLAALRQSGKVPAHQRGLALLRGHFCQVIHQLVRQQDAAISAALLLAPVSHFSLISMAAHGLFTGTYSSSCCSNIPHTRCPWHLHIIKHCYLRVRRLTGA